MSAAIETIFLKGRLSPEQKKAAIDPTNEVLALACAGSGKSRTLAYRIARLIAEGEDPRSIVAFTFTEKAAESIKLRVAGALATANIPPTTIGAMYLGTIHAFCQHTLGEIDATYRQFDVLDENRLKLFLLSRYPKLGLSVLRKRTATKNNPQGSQFRTIAQISNAWKTMHDEMITIEEVTKYDAELGEALARLEQQLRTDQYIDFSLMIRLVVDALRRGDPAVRKSESIAGLKHLMVDEYQDVNPAQELLIQQLHKLSKTLFVVGDDDQAIYAWRGADVSNIRDFDIRYKKATRHTLSKNYRSTEAIVKTADKFAAGVLGALRIAKSPTADTPPGPRQFGVFWFPTREQEAQWVANRIKALLGTAYRETDGTVRGLTKGDFAVLMRSTRTPESTSAPRHAAFTQAFDALDIKYSLESGGGSFDRPQVEALRSSFLMLRNGSPSREEAKIHFESQILPSYPKANFDKMSRVFANWGRQIHEPIDVTRRRVYPQILVHDLLEAFGLPQSPFDSLVMRDIGIFSRMVQDIESVYVSIDSAPRFQDICNFLQNVAESGYDTSTDDVLRRPDAVTVATVHKMKGLEFPVVFIVDVEQRRFPGDKSDYDGWLPRELLKDALGRGAYQSTPEGEARLFYTAATRAERFLYISGAEILPGGKQKRKPSQFSLRLAHPEITKDPGLIPEGLTKHPPRARIDETVIPTSFSEIRYYLACPRNYQFRKSFGFSPPIPDMFGFGMTVHTAVGKLHETFSSKAPTPDQAENVAEQVFHLKHMPPSRDPENRPGGYERAKAASAKILKEYATDYSEDFAQSRQVEVRFEIPVEQAVISGAIDLLLKMDSKNGVLDARVIDFKAMEGGPDPEINEDLHWTELSLQVQLYAKAAEEVLGEKAKTGSVHLLKDNHRIDIPIDKIAVEAAVSNVEWAVGRIVEGDFPMRPSRSKCENCDFQKLCPKCPEEFGGKKARPPAIHVPKSQPQLARAFSEFESM